MEGRSRDSLIRIRSEDPRPIYVQIMDEVRRGVVLGALRPDDPLPSVRDLAAELRVSPNTVAQAYRELERSGEAYTRRGVGTFVASGVDTGRLRESLARGIAEQALREAYRSGVGVDQLLAEIRRAAGEGARPEGVSAP